MKERYRIGIAGVGHAARVRHIEAFSRASRAEVVIALDPDAAARRAALDLGIPTVARTWEDMVETPFDVLVASVPPAAHCEVVEAALRAGKHVLVEKPMAPTSAQGRELERLARETGNTLGVVHNFLFGRAMKRVASLQEAGRLGEMIGATAVHWSSWNRTLPSWADTLPGGLFFDEAPHLLYLIRHFLGDLSVEQVWSDDRSVAGDRRNLRVEVALSGVRGLATMSTWFGASQSEWILALGFTEATVVLDLFRDVAVVLPPEKKRDYRHIIEVPLRGTVQAWATMGRWMAHRVLRGRHLYGNEELVRLYLDSLDTGRPPPVTARDGWTIVALIENIVEMGSLETPCSPG